LNGFTFKIEGVEELQKKLRELPDRFAVRGMRRALRKGANVVRNAARNNAKQIDDPETRERIWKNISVQGGGARRERQAGGPMMRVGVRGGARHRDDKALDSLPGGNTTHWRWVEFGSVNNKAQPFLRPALANNVETATNAIVQAAKIELDKELAKL
jgi:HK97 gp10 family phage protein